jgi:hypothetical protein
LEHRRVKRFYTSVHKGQFVRGITKQQRREQILDRMCQVAPTILGNQAHRKRKYGEERQPSSHHPRIPFQNDEPLPPSSPDRHHEMSKNTRHKVDLRCWIGDLSDDPALEVREHCSYLVKSDGHRCRRTFTPASKNISLGVYLDATLTAMSTASQRRNEIVSSL